VHINIKKLAPISRGSRVSTVSAIASTVIADGDRGLPAATSSSSASTTPVDTQSLESTTARTPPAPRTFFADLPPHMNVEASPSSGCSPTKEVLHIARVTSCAHRNRRAPNSDTAVQAAMERKGRAIYSDDAVRAGTDDTRPQAPFTQLPLALDLSTNPRSLYN